MPISASLSAVEEGAPRGASASPCTRRRGGGSGRETLLATAAARVVAIAAASPRDRETLATTRMGGGGGTTLPEVLLLPTLSRRPRTPEGEVMPMRTGDRGEGTPSVTRGEAAEAPPASAVRVAVRGTRTGSSEAPICEVGSKSDEGAVVPTLELRPMGESKEMPMTWGIEEAGEGEDSAPAAVEPGEPPARIVAHGRCARIGRGAATGSGTGVTAVDGEVGEPQAMGVSVRAADAPRRTAGGTVKFSVCERTTEMTGALEDTRPAARGAIGSGAIHSDGVCASVGVLKGAAAPTAAVLEGGGTTRTRKCGGSGFALGSGASPPPREGRVVAMSGAAAAAAGRDGGKPRGGGCHEMPTVGASTEGDCMLRGGETSELFTPVKLSMNTFGGAGGDVTESSSVEKNARELSEEKGRGTAARGGDIASTLRTGTSEEDAEEDAGATDRESRAAVAAAAAFAAAAAVAAAAADAAADEARILARLLCEAPRKTTPPSTAKTKPPGCCMGNRSVGAA